MPERSEVFEDLLQPVISSLGISLSTQQVRQLTFHYNLLMQWNQKMNLSAIRDPVSIVQRHFGEALFLAKSLPNVKGTLVDVGSGAGFPGAPIAVYRPNLHVTLVEAKRKKAIFLREVARERQNLLVLNARIEMLEQHFDWVTMRAVSSALLLRCLRELAPNLALLVTDQVVAELRENPSISWQSPQPLPWSQERVLLIGQRVEERGFVSVPRETF